MQTQTEGSFVSLTLACVAPAPCAGPWSTALIPRGGRHRPTATVVLGHDRSTSSPSPCSRQVSPSGQQPTAPPRPAASVFVRDAHVSSKVETAGTARPVSLKQNEFADPRWTPVCWTPHGLLGKGCQLLISQRRCPGLGEVKRPAPTEAGLLGCFQQAAQGRASADSCLVTVC